MQEKWLELTEKFSVLSQREKVMILVSGLVCVLLFGVFNILEPTWDKADALAIKNKKLSNELSAFETEISTYQDHLASDPNVSLRQAHDKHNQLLARLDQQLDTQVVDLVSPENMPNVIKSVLQHMQGLKVESLVAHQPKSLLANQPSQNLYRHGFSMRVSGNYQDIYHFLAKAEALPWKFHWQDFQLATVDYPSISLNINIYTLSLKQGFIDL